MPVELIELVYVVHNMYELIIDFFIYNVAIMYEIVILTIKGPRM